jgi:hypothetical protein
MPEAQFPGTPSFSAARGIEATCPLQQLATTLHLQPLSLAWLAPDGLHYLPGGGLPSKRYAPTIRRGATLLQGDVVLSGTSSPGQGHRHLELNCLFWEVWKGGSAYERHHVIVVGGSPDVGDAGDERRARARRSALVSVRAGG